MLARSGFAIGDREIGGIDISWIATWGKGKPVLGVLVEFDALPDLGNEAVSTRTPRRDGVTNGHGCGHNLIGSGAIGAAIALKNHMEKEGIPGTIKVFGCPAEELLAGKKYVSLNVEPAPPGGRLDHAQKTSFDCVIHAVIEHFGIKEQGA